MKGLAGKRIIVAGGATGIGSATCKRLAEEGAFVVVGDFNTAGAEKTVNDIKTAFPNAQVKAIFFDYSDEDSIRDLISGSVDFLGGLDGLVNVGVLGAMFNEKDVDIPHLDPEAWRRTINGNLVGYAAAIKFALPHLEASDRHPAIVNTTSGSIWGGMPFMPAYQAAKAGVLSLTKYLAQYWGPKGIRSNCISPGPILSQAVLDQTPPEHIQNVEKTVPLGRWGQPEEIAALYVFLLSDDASYVNGQTWSCCGGKYLRD